MVYEKEEILQYVIEEDVKFIRMTFCDGRIGPRVCLRHFHRRVGHRGLRGRGTLRPCPAPGRIDALHSAVAARARACGAHVLLGALPGRAAV